MTGLVFRLGDFRVICELNCDVENVKRIGGRARRFIVTKV